MAKNQTRRLTESQLRQDRDAFAALKKVTGYSPANSDCTVAKLQTSSDDLDDAQTAEAQSLAAYQAAQDETIASQWSFHNLVLAAKDQVIAQFGKDSAEVQSVGLKRKSEYKSPKRKKGTTPSA